jgi:hypothetical protein
MRSFVMVVAATLTACATGSAETLSTYVSPADYMAFTCPQLIKAAREVSTQEKSMRSNADNSSGVSADIAWPIGVVGGDKQKLAIRQGQIRALEQASIQKQCSVQFQRPPND